jgi:MoaA/NifB/PqqE/SkfB family radical SAM enzyme
VIKDASVFKDGGFIKVDDFKAIIDKYAKGVDIVFLTGGEALLHPELDNLANIVKSKGLSLKISTNGILIDRWIDSLKLFDFINVSMDGYDYESFKRLRGGTQDQFDRILVGLSLLKKNNIKFLISFLLSEENLDEIYEMLKFAYKFQPSGVEFHNINPHGCKDYTPLTLSSEKVNQIVKAIMSKSDYPFDISLPIIFDTESRHFKTAKCIQPWYYCCFDDKGDISFCCHLRHDRVIGNIFSNYDFNSDMMRNFRRQMIKGEYAADDCLYCHRRFMGEEYGHFDSKLKKWKSVLGKGAVHDDKGNNL